MDLGTDVPLFNVQSAIYPYGYLLVIVSQPIIFVQLMVKVEAAEMMIVV